MGKIHNFWSTVPSTLSKTDQKLKDFINGTVNVVTAYNNTRDSIDHFSSRLLVSYTLHVHHSSFMIFLKEWIPYHFNSNANKNVLFSKSYRCFCLNPVRLGTFCNLQSYFKKTHSRSTISHSCSSQKMILLFFITFFFLRLINDDVCFICLG